MVVAQAFFPESPLDISEEAQGILKHHLFSSVAFPGGKDNKKVACAQREEHGRSHREEGLTDKSQGTKYLVKVVCAAALKMKQFLTSL